MSNDESDLSFSGAKIALICDNSILTYLRDDKPNIPFRNVWDLAGGGREGEESPEQCVIRETNEEFALTIAPTRIVWKRRYENATAVGEYAYFMVAHITREEIVSIKFGDEGQRWQLMKIEEFLDHPNAVPQLQKRLGHYLAEADELEP
jgi:8-oxo-dGTP diphosphatase